MSLILNIDTAVETGSVCLSRDGECLWLALHHEQKLHASWLHIAITEMLVQTGHTIKDVNAVAVTIGPGSYTGLRVSLSAAKGLCYARNIPLITVGTLELLAFAAKNEDTDLICPMIDARRMEVFTALYDKNLETLLPPQEMLLSSQVFAEFLDLKRILFLGNGSKKLEGLLTHRNARFGTIEANAAHMATLSFAEFEKQRFADLVYTEPYYLKDFYSPMHSFA
jgi:tRNA threonylcarbamoyladenosine biosynthesis protein TsaB